MTQDSTNTAVVDRGYFWCPIDENAPRGQKVQRIRRQTGVAGYPGPLKTNEDWYTHWAPMPTFHPDDKHGQ